ncbi:peroxynitrite isomerase THAP4-like [Ostrea edulis]|uniref:peroxynitrite isomerase THAP4-like n=1 Tax=Ostrea edulis TaxID=37623 RepID=UPI002096008C|nr:peroxynitrite isomerase THAP4-like [Ostrea edulis]XP_048746896.1 peroxynitrite isomerase THAP4-like [Ostrea edulis]
MAGKDAPLHNAAKPLEWLIGKWKGQGKGIYPTIQDFDFLEELEFFHVGQPMLQFSFYSVNKETNKPLHREIGFIRIKPGTNQIACISSHNNGVSEMAEGTVAGQIVSLESHTIGRMTFGKDPKTVKLKRTFTLDGDTLHQVVYMETDTVPLTEHLRTTYKKV